MWQTKCVTCRVMTDMPVSQVCRAVDTYLKSLSERGELTVDIFRRVVESVPDECRTNDDTFFDVLRNLLCSGQKHCKVELRNRTEYDHRS
jgi:hypothetical protein